jgi:D-amino-acid oxidase
MDVTVIGAGVIGLATAVALEDRGHHVRVVAAASGEAITSSVAGAVWFPYRAGPPDKVAAWAARTRAWLVDIAGRAPEAGVDVLTGYEITADASEERPWWAAHIDVDRTPAPVTGSPLAWRFTAPRAEPALFLPYLLRTRVERRVVVELAAEPGDAVINCTGLAARELTRDDTVYPLFGQVALAGHGGFDPTVTITDNRDPDAVFYAIPRRDELVLGGCTRPYPPGIPPELDRDLTARILANARALGLDVGAVHRERAGLRPFRQAVRLERDLLDPRVIHNYGHGGAGFTLCHGCADDVVALVEQRATAL